MIDAVAPTFVSDKSWLPITHGIFDLMISRGSPAAQLRKREFARLEQIMLDFMQSNSDMYDQSAYDHATHQNSRQPSEPGEKADHSVEAADHAGQAQGNQQHLGFSEDMGGSGMGHDGEQSWDLLGNFGEFTMSPTELLNLAEDLQVDDFM